jgi:hypothetical protein
MCRERERKLGGLNEISEQIKRDKRRDYNSGTLKRTGVKYLQFNTNRRRGDRMAKNQL